MKFFIASPWRNKSRVEELHEALTTRGYQCYSFLQSGANLMTGISIEEELKMFTNILQDWKNNPDVKKIFEAELEGLKQSDAVILLEPAGRSSLLETGHLAWARKSSWSARIEKPEVALLGANGFYPDLQTFLNDLPNITGA